MDAYESRNLAGIRKYMSHSLCRQALVGTGYATYIFLYLQDFAIRRHPSAYIPALVRNLYAKSRHGFDYFGADAGA